MSHFTISRKEFLQLGLFGVHRQSADKQFGGIIIFLSFLGISIVLDLCFFTILNVCFFTSNFIRRLIPIHFACFGRYTLLYILHFLWSLERRMIMKANASRTHTLTF